MSEDKRLWQYRPGEARIFENREAVPAGEGWRDFPVNEAPNGGGQDGDQPARIEASESPGPAGAEGGEPGEVLAGKPEQQPGRPTLTLPKGAARK